MYQKVTAGTRVISCVMILLHHLFFCPAVLSNIKAELPKNKLFKKTNRAGLPLHIH